MPPEPCSAMTAGCGPGSLGAKTCTVMRWPSLSNDSVVCATLREKSADKKFTSDFRASRSKSYAADHRRSTLIVFLDEVTASCVRGSSRFLDTKLATERQVVLLCAFGMWHGSVPLVVFFLLALLLLQPADMRGAVVRDEFMQVVAERAEMYQQLLVVETANATLGAGLVGKVF